ncbi:MAG: hypothetical protein K6E49_01480 [Lachnospiraceae bacterium]|nr:hypothetical protein [Lachnospiraceae bacterium]
MNITRKILVNLLATMAFVFLFLFPILGFVTTTAVADETTGSAVSTSQDYVFFIVENNDVPLAAAPSADVSSYILWIGLASFVLVIVFIYSSWYFSVRRNIRELSERLSPAERGAFVIQQGFLHPVRSLRLAREAEDTVASIYTRYI